MTPITTPLSDTGANGWRELPPASHPRVAVLRQLFEEDGFVVLLARRLVAGFADVGTSL